MTFTEELLSGIEGAEYRRIRKKEGYVTGAARFPASEYRRVFRHVEEKLEPVLQKGEKILCSLREGEIIDCGIKQFRIKKGAFIEVYDYSRTAVMFIRLYLVSGGAGEWLALYVDENPSTPWWDEKSQG